MSRNRTPLADIKDRKPLVSVGQKREASKTPNCSSQFKNALVFLFDQQSDLFGNNPISDTQFSECFQVTDTSRLKRRLEFMLLTMKKSKVRKEQFSKTITDILVGLTTFIDGDAVKLLAEFMDDIKRHTDISVYTGEHIDRSRDVYMCIVKMRMRNTDIQLYIAFQVFVGNDTTTRTPRFEIQEAKLLRLYVDSRMPIGGSGSTPNGPTGQARIQAAPPGPDAAVNIWHQQYTKDILEYYEDNPSIFCQYLMIINRQLGKGWTNDREETPHKYKWSTDDISTVRYRNAFIALIDKLYAMTREDEIESRKMLSQCIMLMCGVSLRDDIVMDCQTHRFTDYSVVHGLKSTFAVFKDMFDPNKPYTIVYVGNLVPIDGLLLYDVIPD